MIHITSNYHVREAISGSVLPETIRKQFDYISDEEWEWHDFVKYRGEWYDLNDVERAPDNLRAMGWDDFVSDSFWSGIAFRYFDKEGHNLDGVIVGSVYWP